MVGNEGLQKKKMKKNKKKKEKINDEPSVDFITIKIKSCYDSPVQCVLAGLSPPVPKSPRPKTDPKFPKVQRSKVQNPGRRLGALACLGTRIWHS